MAAYRTWLPFSPRSQRSVTETFRRIMRKVFKSSAMLGDLCVEKRLKAGAHGIMPFASKAYPKPTHNGFIHPSMRGGLFASLVEEFMLSLQLSQAVSNRRHSPCWSKHCVNQYFRNDRTDHWGFGGDIDSRSSPLPFLPKPLNRPRHLLPPSHRIHRTPSHTQIHLLRPILY